MGERLRQDSRLDYMDALLEKHLLNQGVVNQRGQEIQAPPYSVGTFNSIGQPLQDKAKYMFEKILNGSATVNTIEGGVRGGKDVFGLNIWAKLLMVSTEKLHLALGTSLEHALKTIFDSNGFGLKYLIPHGNFVRNSEDGGIRGVFKFQNLYGQEREVHFYGNSKVNDSKKFQGFTFGTAYINEGINQHINGILEAQQRTATSKDRRIIITQNPVGTSHVFYAEFEQAHMLTDKEIDFINKIQKDRLIQAQWNLFNKKERAKTRKAAKLYTQKLLKKYNKSVPDINAKDLNEQLAKILTHNELEELYSGLFNIKVELEHGQEYMSGKEKVVEFGVMSVPVEEFVEIPKELKELDSPKLPGASMYKLMKYDTGLDNINNVVNGYDYNYFHFTMRDNIGMSDMQINDFTKGYDKTSAKYKQRFLGERVSSDGLLFPQFSDDNILYGDIKDYEQKEHTLRVISIDPGANHPTGIVDAEVDLTTGEIFVLGEEKLELKDAVMESRSFLTIETALWQVIRRRKGRRKPDMLIIDPSNPFLISYFQTRNFNVVPANNKTQSSKSKEYTYGDKTIKKGTKGVDLMSAGFMRLKFFIHESCVETIKDVSGMSVVFNENTGNDDIIKVNDDMFDAFKYIANTSGIDPSMWDESEVLENYERELLQNETRENEKGNLERKQSFQQRLDSLKSRRQKAKQSIARTVRFDKKWYN